MPAGWSIGPSPPLAGRRLPLLLHHARRACGDRVAHVGDLERARHHLERAEKSALLWQGTWWEAGMAEAQAIAAGTSSMIEQNRQASSQPIVDSARSTTARASRGSGVARIIVPKTRWSRWRAITDDRAWCSASCKSCRAAWSSPSARRTSASRWRQWAWPAMDPRSRWSSLASLSSAAARARSPESSAASPISAEAKAAARSAPLRLAVACTSRATTMTWSYGVCP